jgi:hypothetical protein
MECDPYELTNLVGLDSHRAVADVMRDRLVRRMTEVGEQAPASSLRQPGIAGRGS